MFSWYSTFKKYTLKLLQMQTISFIFLILLYYCSDVKGVIWPCSVQEHCDGVNNSKCSQFGNCMCSEGYVFSEDFSNCLQSSSYGQKCEESVQCNHMPIAGKCKQGICECIHGYTYVRGRCRLLKRLHESCNKNIECYFGYDRESVMCRNNNCECADNYYERYDNVCRRKSITEGGVCVVNEDCDDMKNLTCVKLQCKQNINLPNTKDITTQTSFSSQQINTQDDSLLSNQISYQTVNAASQVGDSCAQHGQPCEDLPHSICVEGFCYCQLGYYPRNGLCFAELGEIAESKKQCEQFYNTENKKCICKPNFFYETNLRICRKPAVKIESSCVFDGQCSPFGAAYCAGDKVKRCFCQSNAVYNETLQLCTPLEKLGAKCEKDTDCTLENTVCSQNSICICKMKFIEKNGICGPGIGANCLETKDCIPENSYCKVPDTNFIKEQSSCECKPKFVNVNTTCLKEVTDLDENCVDDEQCKPLLGSDSKCTQDKCACSEKHFLNYEKCEEKKELGEKCSSLAECYVKSEPQTVECRNQICQCSFGLQHDVEKQFCGKAKRNASSGPNFLKMITLILIASAVLVTGAAIREAYY